MNIYNMRKAAGLGQKEVGEKLGFSARTVSNWECSNREPDLETLKKIARLFDITYDELLDY